MIAASGVVYTSLARSRCGAALIQPRGYLPHVTLRTTTCIRSANADSNARTITSEGQAPETLHVCREEPREECMAVGDSVVCEFPLDATLEDTEYDMECLTAGDAPVCAVPEPANGLSTIGFPLEGLTAQIAEVALLISPFFFWGTSMPVLKTVLPHSTPLLLAAVRLLPSGAVLAAWAAANGRTSPTSFKAWAWIAAFALVDGAAFQGFLAEGLSKTSAGLGSVIIDSQPLTVAVLAAILFGEVLSSTAILGLALGIVGLLLVEVPQSTLETLVLQLPSGGVADKELGSADFFDGGAIYMLLAAQSMALGTVMVRYVTKYSDPVFATGYHMIMGGAMLLGAALVQEPTVIQDTLDAFTLQDSLSMAYVSLFGGAASYGIFFYAASKQGNLTALSSLTFLTPVFAVISSWIALGETLSPAQLAGAVVTISAVTLINHRNDGQKNSKKTA